MLERAVQDAAEHELSFALEYRIVRADGEVRWVLDRGQLVPGSGGRLWIDGAMFDVTERRAAEEALREREVERARSDELRASRARIVEAADAARRRIERDLHDGAQQRLVLVSLTLKRAEARAKGTPAEEVLVEASEQLREGLAELRDLAHGIHPAVLGEHGLGAALDGLVARCPFPVDVRVAAERAAPAVEAAIYFTIAEALTNVAKYAQAIQASVTIEVEDGTLVAEVDRRRRRRGEHGGRLGPARARGPPRRHRRDAHRAQPRGEGHDDPRLRAAGPGRVGRPLRVRTAAPRERRLRASGGSRPAGRGVPARLARAAHTGTGAAWSNVGLPPSGRGSCADGRRPACLRNRLLRNECPPPTPAGGALAVEHDLVLGHGEGDAVGEAVDGALEVVVGEGLHVAAAIADHVVMVVAVGAGGLVAGRALADLDARDEGEADELVEHAVDRGAGDAATVGAQRVLDVVGAQCAGLTVEQRDDRGARAAAAEAGLGEAAVGVLGPRLHRSRW